MVEREHCTLLGLLAKTHGTRGELLIKTESNAIIKNKTESLFVEIDNIMVPFFIENFKNSTSGIIVKFDDISTPEKASRFINCKVFIAAKDLTQKSRKKYIAQEIEGYIVCDLKLGKLGNVTEIGGHPLNPLLSVNFNNNIIYIPINEHFIIKVDRRKKIIETDLPDGLIDLNKRK